MSAAKFKDRELRVLHVLRAPLGGLFRHVVDLAREQAARGHAVGIITDLNTGGQRAADTLAKLEPSLTLGVTRLPMQRNPHWSDIAALAHVVARIRESQPDVVHGHGSKGGLYARLPAYLPGAYPCARAYTPHGGSFNYRPGSLVHGLYMKAEWALQRVTDIFLFESAYIGRCFDANVGQTKALKRCVWNGITEAETTPVPMNADPVDFVYIGELRSAKGIDTLIDALVEVTRRVGTRCRAVLVGSGPDEQALHALAHARGLDDLIEMPGPLPAREAFAKGRILVVPSRAESLPYVVLEAAAGHMPMIATNVGGIPEIFGPFSDQLIPCDNVDRLATAMIEELGRDEAERRARADALAEFVAKTFTIANMVDAVIAGYHDALQLKTRNRFAAPVAVSS